MNEFDVIVVGVGTMGASACDHLARRGVRVLGLEQFTIPHDRGSHHGFSRMIRTAYYEHPDYVPLLRRAWTLWRELEDETKTTLLYATGGLYLGPPESEFVSRSRASAERHGVVHEMLDRAALAAKYPQFQVPKDFAGFYERDAGFLLCERAVTAMVERARRHGAEIRASEPVRDWSEDASGVVVTTTRQSYRAGQVVFCGGAWTDRLVTDLGVKLQVTRQVLGWVAPRQPESFALGRLPVWAIDNMDDTIHYGFPVHPDMPGFKLAHHARGAVSDPDRVERNTTTADEATFRPMLRRCLPGANGETIAIKTCLYTNTPDHRFILDRLPGHSRATIACGFSGHGFKFAPVVGEIVADLALAGRTPLPARFLSLERFG